jgi:5-methylcytosine-specific restriction endonuclease McrA
MKSMPKRCLKWSECHSDAQPGKSYCTRHYQTRQGRRGPGSSQWLALRREVLQRDQYTCTIEGCTHSYGLEIHRIGGGHHRGTSNEYVALCPTHHRAVQAEETQLVRDREPLDDGDTTPAVF